MVILRNYQRRVKEALYDRYKMGYNRAIAVMPTGAGKTALAGSIIKDAYDLGLKANFVVPYNTLLEQTQEEFLKLFGMRAGLVGGNVKEDRTKRVQIVSYQTLGGKKRDLSWLQPKFTVVDECHLTNFAEPLLKLFPKGNYKDKSNGKLLGLTATPYRSKSDECLGDIYESGSLVVGPSYKELIATGALVHPIYYEIGNCYGQSMASSVEYNVRQWQKYGQNDQTLVFTNTCDRCDVYKEAFESIGITAQIITGRTGRKARKTIIQDFKDFKLKVLISVTALSAGFNARNARVCLYDSNDFSKAAIIQKKGRVMRSYTHSDGRTKKDCIILDCVGVKQRIGRIDDIVISPRDLEDSDRTNKKLQEKPLKQCPKCEKWVAAAIRTCNCGHKFDFVPQDREIPDGDLERSFANRAEENQFKVYVQLLIGNYRAGNPLEVADQTFEAQFGHSPYDEWKQNAIVSSYSSPDEIQRFTEYINKNYHGREKFKQLSLYLHNAF